MDGTPEVSVVLPTRGDVPHLRPALATALAAGARIEVLLVHDRAAGAPATPPALREDPRVRLLELAAGGPSRARNAGLAAARGRLVAFLDDDDLWLPGHLERAREALARHRDATLYACDAYLLADATPDGSLALPGDPASLPRFAPGGVARVLSREELLLANPILTPTVVLVRERLAEDERFRTDLPVMEDYDLWLRLARRHVLIWDPRPGAVVRRRPGSASRDRRRMAEGSLRILEPLLGQDGRAGLARPQAHRRLGRLWHDLAYACLIEGDAVAARGAARRAVALLPLAPKNYMYLLAGALPTPLRRRLVDLARRRAGKRAR